MCNDTQMSVTGPSWPSCFSLKSLPFKFDAEILNFYMTFCNKLFCFIDPTFFSSPEPKAQGELL